MRDSIPVRAGLVAASLLFTWGVAEVALRLLEGAPLRPHNFLAERLDLMHSAYPASHDYRLGWIPEAGASGSDNFWGTQVAILADGVRSNGRPVAADPPARPLVLAVGDSFTFGDEVSDAETWPAYLEAEIGGTVLNGGVFGYGLDQIALRAEVLLERYRPDLLVSSLIPDDVHRCELSMRSGSYKPYFELAPGGLALRNVPVPPPESPSSRLGRPRALLGHSFAVHWLMLRVDPKTWLTGTRWGRRRVSSQGAEIACRLMARLAGAASRSGARALILLQYPKTATLADRRLAAGVAACARRAGLSVLDLLPELDRLRSEDPDGYAALIHLHMSPEGNRWVASAVARTLEREGWIEPRVER